jgi:serine protease inhibitor
MKIVDCLVLGLLASLLPAGCAAPSQGGEPAASAPAGTAFGLDLYARLSKTEGNLFFSPYSVSTCLALAYAGARDGTEAEMARVLHFPLEQSALHRQLGSLQRELAKTESQAELQLNIADALWTQEGHPFLPAFLQVAQHDYGANINQVDFKTQAPAATRDINRWVAQQTKDKIQNILPPGIINAYTRLVLANAIYFKGIWADTFPTNATTAQPFHVSQGRQVQAPLMHRQQELRYVQTPALQAVDIPYAGRQISMLVLLPRQADGLPQLNPLLTLANLRHWETQMAERRVDLFLPRFKLESAFELAPVLAAMGMPSAFQANADFSGIDGQRDLSISALIHKAWVEVNEQGTEAAAATVGVIHATAVRREPPPVVFRADHPFLFLIRDTRSHTLLFVGRVVAPAQTGR